MTRSPYLDPMKRLAIRLKWMTEAENNIRLNSDSFGISESTLRNTTRDLPKSMSFNECLPILHYKFISEAKCNALEDKDFLSIVLIAMKMYKYNLKVSA